MSQSQARTMPPPIPQKCAKKRPVVLLIIGILSVLFGGYGILTLIGSFFLWKYIPALAKSRQIYSDMGNMYLLQGIGAMNSVILIFAGIGLIRIKQWGRTCFSIYFGLTVVTTVVNAIITLPNTLEIATQSPETPEFMRSIMIGAMVVGFVIGLGIPLVSLIYLNLHSTKRSIDDYNETILEQ